MKSLEEVIKQNCKFLGNSKKPYELYNLEPYSYTESMNILLFSTNDNVKSKSIITLLTEMTPLLTYISSCMRYYNNLHLYHEQREMNLRLIFPNAELNFRDQISLNRNNYIDPIENINYNIHDLMLIGYCFTFQSPFRVEITLDRSIIMRENQVVYSFDPSNFDECRLIINDNKTFKNNECIICLEENKNNVLFCNCGHLCLCEQCFLRTERSKKCPVCKTINTVIRIIE